MRLFDQLCAADAAQQQQQQRFAQSFSLTCFFFFFSRQMNSILYRLLLNKAALLASRFSLDWPKNTFKHKSTARILLGR
jgi:hypothetical protein